MIPGGTDTRRPDLSVVIVNRNTRDLLRACLESIAVLPDDANAEIIVVDNGSSDGSPEMVRDAFPHARLIRNQTNTGYAYPNNQGIAVSRGRYVMLLNSDTEVRPRAFDRLVNFMDAHPEVGACGPALFYPDGRPQPSISSFPSLWRHFCDVTFLDRIFPRSRWFADASTWFDHAHTRAIDQPAGAALMVRREVVEQVGPLDERFSIYYNDVDWCYRIYNAGWSIFFVREAEIVHHQGVTTSNENRKFALAAEMVKNRFDYFAKRFGGRGLAWFRAWTMFGYLLRRLVFGVPYLLFPSERSRWHTHYYREMWRAARKGAGNEVHPGFPAARAAGVQPRR